MIKFLYIRQKESDMDKCLIRKGVQTNKVKFAETVVYYGFITLYTSAGKYLYRIFSPVTRLNKDDAKQDALNLYAEKFLELES